MSRLDFTAYLDFVDPLSYRLAKELHARFGAADSPTGLSEGIRVLPFEVCPPPAPVLDPASSTWTERWALARSTNGPGHQVQQQPTLPWVPWTRKAHELAQHAHEKGLFRQVHELLFQAHLVDGQDIGRVDVLVNLAESLGLDRTETKAVLDVDRFNDRIEIVRADAAQRGVTEPATVVTAEGEILPSPGCFAVIDTLAPPD